MTPKELATHIANGIFAVGVIVFVALGKMPLMPGLLVLGALLVPSSLPAIYDAISKSLTDAPPPKGPSIMGVALLVIAALRLLSACSVLAVFVILAACGAVKPADVKEAKDDTKLGLTVLEEVCVFANAAFSKTTIAKACNIADPYLDAIDKTLASKPAGAGAGPSRPFPVTCEQTDAGIVCEKPYREDAGSAK